MGKVIRHQNNRLARFGIKFGLILFFFILSLWFGLEAFSVINEEPVSHAIKEFSDKENTITRQLDSDQVIKSNEFKEAPLLEEDKMLLARAVYSEARGEKFDGQVAVAAVILNRVESTKFPSTVEEVIFEPGAFSVVDDGQFWLEPDQQSIHAVEEALEGKDPSGGALYFYNPETARASWIETRQVIQEIGEHRFTR